MYIGTDLVSLGSYYTGGIAETSYENKRQEYDFVSNIRAEQYVNKIKIFFFY